MSITDRFALSFDNDRHRRSIAGKEVVLHCHHYNARIQRTIEGAAAIDGKALWVSRSEGVFSRMLLASMRADDSRDTRREVAEALYAHLGFGRLDFSKVADGVITSAHSHFVEGWLAGLEKPSAPVCSVAEGYIQAAVHALSGELAHVREVACRGTGADECRFEIDRTRTEPLFTYERAEIGPGVEPSGVATSNIDEQKIVSAVAAMPISGGAEGLVPAFNVYLASTPADLYNLVCIGFVEAMDEKGLGQVARRQLMFDAETCGLNTFRGIMSSPEWDVLVEPMVKEPRDKLFGIVAVSNALGWGQWRVLGNADEEGMTIASADGYEAAGYLGLRGPGRSVACVMLTGVAAGIMELVYGRGSFADRFGQYASREQECRCAPDGATCSFVVEEAA